MTKKTTINKIISSKAFWIIISLLGSFLLWMYIMSTEETTIEKTFSNVKVVYQGADDLRAARGLIVTDADADSVTVRLKGTRRVLGNLSSADLSAVIDVSGISQAREMQVSYSLQYPTNVDKSSITVLSKSPETISFSVVQEANKTLEVKGVFTGSVKEGYTAEPIKVEPSSITLYGPQEELDVVDSICVYVTRTDLDKSIAPTNCPYVLLDKDGNVPNMNKAMLADAAATCFGAVCGTSTVTTFVESSAGIAEGGKTGLSSVFTAAMFFIAMFLAPIAALIPSCATAASLIFVGILMIGGVKEIDWSDASAAVPAFMTMAIMPFTYNISYGIAFGLISYIFIKLFTGKIKDISLSTWIIGILFAAMFFIAR